MTETPRGDPPRSQIGLSAGSLLLSLLLCVSASAATPRPPSVKTARGSLTALRTLGYSPRVARRIAAEPRLTAEILRLRSKPIRLFRGIDEDAHRFDPAFYSTDPVGRLCFAKSAMGALEYAVNYHQNRLRRGDKQGILLDVELPSHLVSTRDDYVFHLDQDRQANVNPFIRRFGTINLRKVKGDGGYVEPKTMRAVRWSNTPP